MTTAFHAGCQSNNLPPTRRNPPKAQSRLQSFGGHDSPNQSPADPKPNSDIDFADYVQPLLSENYLGVFRHPFLGKAELLYDDKNTPRLVLNDKWTSRVYMVKPLDQHEGRGRSINRTLHCFFDDIPWLPRRSKVIQSI